MSLRLICQTVQTPTKSPIAETITPRCSPRLRTDSVSVSPGPVSMPSRFIAQFTGLEKKVHLFCKLIPLYCGVNSLHTIKERETKHMVIHLELSNLKGVSKIHRLCTGLTEYFKSRYIYSNKEGFIGQTRQ